MRGSNSMPPPAIRTQLDGRRLTDDLVFQLLGAVVYTTRVKVLNVKLD